MTVDHPIGRQDIIADGDENQRLIKNLLHKALIHIFFIDGEQLREFFKVSSPKKIAEAIDNVSQLELMYKVAENLEPYGKQLRSNVKSTTPQLKAVQKQIEYLQEEIEERKSQIQKIDEEREKDNHELALVEEYLRKHNDASVAAFQRERDFLEKDIASLRRHFHEEEAERDSYLVDIAPYILLKDDIKTAYILIQQKVDKGELPPRIKETFVQELIERGRCICGNELIGDAKHELETYSRKLSLSELSEVCLVGKTTIEEILSAINDFPDKIDKLNEKIDQFKEEYDQKMRRLEYISVDL